MSRADGINLLKKIGVAPGTYFGAPKTAAPVVKPQDNGFFGNVFNSAKNIVGGAVSGVAGGVSKGFQDFAKGLYQAPQMGQNLAALESRQRSNKAMADKYASDFKAGKISKTRYKSLLKGIQGQSMSNAGDATALVDETVTPEDFVKGAGTVLSTATAFGKLGGLGFGGKAANVVNKAPGMSKVAAIQNPGVLASVQSAPKALLAAPFRQALVTGPTADAVVGTGAGVAQGDFMKAAGNAASLAVPGAVAVGGKLLKGASALGKKTFFNTAGVFDNIKIRGGQSVTSALDDVARTDPDKARQIEDVLRVAQDNIMKQYKGDPDGAAKAITEYIEGQNLGKMSVDDLVRELHSFASSNTKISKLAQSAVKKGATIVTKDGAEITPGEIARIGAVKSTQAEKATLSKILKATKDKEESYQALTKFIQDNPRFYGNDQNQRIINKLLNNGNFGDDAAKIANDSLRGTNQLFIKGKDGTLKALTSDSYYAGVRGKGAVNFADDASKTAALERGNKAVFGGVGKTLRKMGISPEEVSVSKAKSVFKEVQSNFTKSVDEMKLNGGLLDGKSVFSRLKKLSEGKRDVIDIRQLRIGEIQDALGVTSKEAKAVIKAYGGAFKSASLEDRGLAGKIMDAYMNTRVGSQYSRIQSAGKYAYNPFFKLQEKIETRVGVQALTGRSAIPKKDYTSTIKTLKDHNILTASGFGAEGADTTLGTIGTKLMRGQEKNIAAGVEALAEKQGVKVADFLADTKNSSLIEELRTIVEYPNKGFTSSNAAKLLNLAIFPARYNIKVTEFALKQFAKQPAVVQIGIAKNIADFDQFVKSDEGIKWQADNKEAIGLVKYFTPLGTIQQVMGILDPRKEKRVSDFGLIGGLPFGIITQVLSNQGGIKTGSPYIDPRTGEVYSDKIPQSLKARAHRALSDIIGTMYNYPGRVAGADRGYGKQDINELIPNMIPGLGKPGKDEYETVGRTDLTAEQRRQVNVLKALNEPKTVSQVHPKSFPQLANFKKTNAAFRPVTPKASTAKGKRAKTKAVPIGRPF